MAIIGSGLLSRRANAPEMMDDFSITDERLENALLELRQVNRFLGGYGALLAELRPLLRARMGRELAILDLGTGIADIPEVIVRWGERKGVHIHVTAVDANDATVVYARERLVRRLPGSLRDRVRAVTADALQTGYPDASFDVVTASLFLHHFDDAQAVALLREMTRLASAGIIVNDLHRHRMAYWSIKAIARFFPVSDMFRHDGPVSVRRAFTKSELKDLAAAAGLTNVRIRWHWAFRWTLSTVGES